MLGELTGRLLQLSQCPRLSIREMALSALSSTAAAAEGHLRPTPTTWWVLAQLLQLVEERFWTVRGRALECLGHVAIAVGKDAFLQYLPVGMAAAEQILQMTDAQELLEYTYPFFGVVAKVIGADFTPYLGTLGQHLIEVVARSDYEARSMAELRGGRGNDEGFNLAGLGDSGDGDEDDDEDEDEGGQFMTVRTADLDAKRTAIIALGMIGEFSGPGFAQNHLQGSFAALFAQREYFHEAIRLEIMTAVSRLVRGCVASVFGSVEAYPKWTPGEAVPLEQVDRSGAVAPSVLPRCEWYRSHA